MSRLEQHCHVVGKKDIAQKNLIGSIGGHWVNSYGVYVFKTKDNYYLLHAHCMGRLMPGHFQYINPSLFEIEYKDKIGSFPGSYDYVINLLESLDPYLSRIKDGE